MTKTITIEWNTYEDQNLPNTYDLSKKFKLTFNEIDNGANMEITGKEQNLINMFRSSEMLYSDSQIINEIGLTIPKKDRYMLGMSFHELNEQEQTKVELRFVCEGCGEIVLDESDLDYIYDEDCDSETQLCRDCV